MSRTHVGIPPVLNALETVTLAVDCAVFPAASYAFAVKVWLAFVRLVVLYVVEYGDDVSEVKDDPPSTLMSTLETPTLSVAFAVKLIVPDTVEHLQVK